MGVSVRENHQDLELVDRAACQIPQAYLKNEPSSCQDLWIPKMSSMGPGRNGCLARMALCVPSCSCSVRRGGRCS